MKISTLNLSVVLIGLFALPNVAPAAVQPNGIFSDHMVLQRDRPVPIWGMADPGEKITVSFQTQHKEVTADPSGKWLVKLDPMPANTTPAALSIKGTNEVTVNDVLVGEVWLCSGQSNMAMTMGGTLKNPKYLEDITSANFPLVRQGTVPKNPAIEPQDSVPVTWQVCTPDTVKTFSATSFYFARRLNGELGVPIGIVVSSVGATSAMFWTGKDMLDTDPDFKAMAERDLANAKAFPDRVKTFPDEMTTWEQANGRTDPPNRGEKEGWMNPNADKSGWLPGKVGAKWSDLGLPDGGVVWIRKEEEIASGQAGKNLQMTLGYNINQTFTVYWNGSKIEDFGLASTAFTTGPTVLTVPGADVKAGTNLLAIRYVAQLGTLAPALTKLPANNDDEYTVKVESSFPPLAEVALAARPHPPKDGRITTLYNGMIRPLMPFTIRGAIWYQGENDVGGAITYQKLLSLLITGWRTHWMEGDFPFLIQQLPNYGDQGATKTTWAALREAQWKVSRNVPNAALSVAIDIGQSHDLHPADKRDIGTRLANVALNQVYGKKIVCSGPVFTSATKDDKGSYHVKFVVTGTLKTQDGKAPAQFCVAGPDHLFVEATASIQGDEIVVSCPQVPQPAALRYAWISDPVGVNLTDDSGLPTEPFRTDDWPFDPNVHTTQAK